MEFSGLELQIFHPGREGDVYDFCTDELICAFEFVRGSNRMSNNHWVPIGWARISELAKIAEDYVKWSSQQIDLIEDEYDTTVSSVVTRPIWWCHVFVGHSSIYAWLSNAHCIHPTVSICLRNEGKQCSDCMDHFGFEVSSNV
ncbi:uncharacterized protein LOC110020681 [Phalaenopsis equestris]|uniref:uncharacterized protein LOC110020681 n=1 Tax=Phalaenopsis equestris TaxID=78828 RepID=UPI0009E45321|nr:uncharacterized protein LOC110020681 [Phalaenopsis equestris]